MSKFREKTKYSVNCLQFTIKTLYVVKKLDTYTNLSYYIGVVIIGAEVEYYGI